VLTALLAPTFEAIVPCLTDEMRKPCAGHALEHVHLQAAKHVQIILRPEFSVVLLHSAISLNWSLINVLFQSSKFLLVLFQAYETASVIWWSEFLITDPEVPGLIPGATRFYQK
jgi:hypothetical protein